MSPTSNAKAAARELARIWGMQPKVFRHWDEKEQHSIAIASCDNVPFDGCVAVGTVGLSDHSLQSGQLRIELIGAFSASFKDGANVAATCAFNAFKDGLPAQPDAIHVNAIGLYSSSTTVPHVLLTDPFLWDNGPETLDVENLRIAWLMIVPISESERRFADANGTERLATLLEQNGIDIFDLYRAPVV